MSTRPRRRRPPREGVLASVVVPVLNGAKTLPATLASLDAQTIDPSQYEIVVVDDGSTDGTPDLVEAFAQVARSPVRLVRIPHAGPAAARNAGVNAATTDAVAFTDADVEVAPDWLERGLKRLYRADADAVEGSTLPKGDPGTLTHQMRNVTGGLYMTCNMIYRRDAIGAAGGFDERFKAAFLEDSDLAFRVIANGGEIVFDPGVVAYHQIIFQGRRKFWKDARKRLYVPLIKRSHPKLYKTLLRPVVPMFPPVYLEELLAIAALATAIATRAWAAAIPVALLLGLALRRVAHALRARDPISFVQAALMPFVQGFWVLLGTIKFMRAGRYAPRDPNRQTEASKPDDVPANA